jgi:periplasmic divalent cation tolerance protein
MSRPDEMDDPFSVVLVTCPAEASEKIARAVLDACTAACVNIVPDVRSLYRWEGKVEDARECLLLIKTRTALLGELERVVKGAHPYEVPEILAEGGSAGGKP